MTKQRKYAINNATDLKEEITLPRTKMAGWKRPLKECGVTSFLFQHMKDSE